MIAPTDYDVEKRTKEIGLELFERAHHAEPKFWNRAWWEKQVMEWTAKDPHFQTQLFRFTEALPNMTDDADVARHFKEYLDPHKMKLPGIIRFAVNFDDPTSLWGRSLGAMIRSGSHSMGGMFMTGTNTQEAIRHAEHLRVKRMAFTLDVLGEATISDRQADRAAAVYTELIDKLGRAAKDWEHIAQIDNSAAGPQPKANISIKLSALDPVFDPIDPQRVMANVGKRLRPIFDLARRHGVFVNIDMESYKHRDLTKWLFMSLLDEPAYRDWTDIGIVVQAYLQDGEQDYLDFLDWVKRRGAGIAVRLVKGAYWDTETAIAVRNNTRIPVWTRKWESDACYERITGLMLENAALIRPAFASHNVRSLAHVMAAAEYAGLEPKHYELQMLAGMGNPLKEAIVQMGRCLRIYCPYGDLLQGMGYLIRRLLENTSNDSFLKQGFGDRASYDRLLANPGDARPPSAPLPQRHYQDTFEEESMSGFENAVNTGFGSAANRDKLSAAIAAARKHAGAKHPLLIGGEHVTTTEWIESTNPAHPHEIIGYVAKAGAAHADQAVAAATRALERWSHRSPFERADIVRKLGTLLEEHRFELAAALVIGIGKNFPQADAEITEAVDYCNYHAALVEQFARRPRRRNVPGEDNVLVYDPCGVCALICSFDFPLALLAGMTTAAVVAGNTTVVKPSSSAPVIAARFVALCQEAGMPAGVISFVPGPGEIVGTHLAEHPGVHLVAFCGSRGNGLDVLANATRVRPNQRHMKRTIIDAGAKNAIIVDHDVDVDEAVSGVLESSFAFTGQKCTACSRVIALADVYDKFCAKIAEAAKTMVIGDPATPGTQIGPVIHANAKARVNAYIDEARKSARMLYEAGADELPDEGHYVAPVVLADVDPRSRIATQEVFGPVLAVIRAADIDEALRIANDSDYALTGGLYSRSPSHIERARWEFRVGNLYINRKITGSQVDVQPYGGAKLSGDGARLGGPDYIRQYTRPRTISENTIRHGLTASNDEPASQEAIAR